MDIEPKIIRLQYASGGLFSTYLTLHLTSHLFAHGGWFLGNSVRDVFRHYYQSPVVEVVVVLGSALVHAGCGLYRLYKRRERQRVVEKTKQKAPLQVPWELRLHRLSGYYLTLAYFPHLLATRGAWLALGIETDYRVVSFVIERYPLLYYPYYFALGMSGAFHLLSGLYMSCRYAGIRVGARGKRIIYALALAGAATMFSTILALGGAYYAQDYDRSELSRELGSKLGFVIF